MHIGKNIQYLILLCLFPFLGITQQLPQFSQYMYNTVAINPAYAGSRERLNITLLNRNQWVGLDGAPVTQTMSMHSAIPGTNLGVGLSLINDKLGYENSTYLYTDVSYTINTSKDFRLSFGIKFGLSRYGLNADLLSDPDAIGDQYLDKIFNNWQTNIGIGVYYRSDDWYIGLSAPRFFNYENNTDIEYLAIDRVSSYFIGGYMYKFNPQLKFKPTFLVKYTNGAPVSVDLTANFLINEKLWLGAAYRVTESLGALMSIQANDYLKFGYSYEFNTSALTPYTSGSHEIFISYEFDFPRPSCNCENNF
jgi:type IX secretion system PorP/SprF family membrane protein